MSLNVFNILQKVYGARGLPFPQKPSIDHQLVTATGFNASLPPNEGNNDFGTPIKRYTDELLGKYEFMPVSIDGIEIPNAIIMISGEKEIIETNVVGAINKKGEIVGATVFEKAFTKPYDITVIATLIGYNNADWPEEQFKRMVGIWKKDDVVTVKCALADYFLESRDNGLITKIAILDNAGSENVEVVQFDLRSNIDFELEIK